MSTIGKTLGTFTLEAQIGKGGMGEVYQAKDQKLGRDVAIKVLPEEFAKDADRVARFQREAKLLASLNHPNIAAIYGLEESGGTHFLILELIEGDTLADRLKRGPIPVEESLKLALQIAEALEAAHEKGVIHRDLKPANIKVTPDGKVKVLDFGLAKAFAGEQTELNLSNSPTLSAAATQQGVILGTAAYMSPEQAKGKSLDKRTDVWAFGCVLFEMLAGEAAFQGEDVTEILASVVKASVNLEVLPKNLHPRVREILTQCLKKDLKDRYRDIGDVKLELEKANADPSGLVAQPVSIEQPLAKPRQIFPWIVLTAILCIIIAGLVAWHLKPYEPGPVTRFYHELDTDQELNTPLALLAVSPDGKQFVYATRKGLCLRSLDGLDAKLIAGTENSKMPFFSPDGKWIGYWSETEGQLMKIRTDGGAPVFITRDEPVGYLSWYKEDTILYTGEQGIMSVSSNEGVPELLIKETDNPFYTPRFLPDQKSVIFTQEIGGVYKITVQSLESGEKSIVAQGSDAYYLPTGHLVYLDEKNNLVAQPFDLKKLKSTGPQVPMIEDIARFGPPEYAISNSGTLVYMSGTNGSSTERTLVWVNKSGNEEALAAPPNAYANISISPDDSKIALSIESNDETDIWIWDPSFENLRRLTFDGNSSYPLWTSDGKHIVFSRQTQGIGYLCRTAADGMGEIDQLLSLKNGALYPWSYSRDGKTLLLCEYAFAGIQDMDISALSMKGDQEKRLLLNDKYWESQTKIAPNGQWMAYVSDDEGQGNVYVRPYPEIAKGKRQISMSGGHSPIWSPEGKQLFYRHGDEVISVPVGTGPDFSYGNPKILFRGMYLSVGYGIYEITPWDISPDGNRFLMIKPPQATDGESAAETPRKINIVLNWFEELKERVPTD